MASSTVSPGTLANDASFGTAPWVNASNAGASDGAYSTASVTGAAPSQYLKATNFGFSIPAGAIIDGIEVSIERKGSGAGQAKDNRVRLVKGGTIQATDKASANIWGASDEVATYGGAADLWSDTWTRDDIMDAGFGVVLQATANAGSPTAEVDHIQMTITYTAGSQKCEAGSSINWKRIG